jgi:hypothetical protein
MVGRLKEFLWLEVAEDSQLEGGGVDGRARGIHETRLRRGIRVKGRRWRLTRLTRPGGWK